VTHRDPPNRPPRGPRPPGESSGESPWGGTHVRGRKERSDDRSASVRRERPAHDAPARAPHGAPARERPAHDRAHQGRAYEGRAFENEHDPYAHDAEHASHPARERRSAELRLYGLNAIHAVFSRRPQSIRKLYLAESRIPALQPLLKWCVANRVGYRVVDELDLHKLAASSHHEGVVADVLREEPQSVSTWLRDLPSGPQCAIWLDGVGNPHNFGAILRSAAHFGVSAILLPKHSTLALSGAAARVAEGGAEAVPLVRLGREDNAIAQLRGAGFTLAATVVKGGTDAFAANVPERTIYVIGAEGEGMDRELAAACDLRLSIPGTGLVESLNVASATAVLLALWNRRR